MFGYVTVCKPELKMKDYYTYRAYYCGLCKVLKEKYGFLGQMTLTYDMTFLVLLLTSLYEEKPTREQNRCVVHPVKKHDMLFNEITEYAADMNIVLTYFHFADDWNDEKSKVGLAGMRALRKTYLKIREQYPKKCEKIRRCLVRLQKAEKRKEESIDVVSGYFGELMGELLLYKEDVWKHTLKRLGFYLGKYIYILDAYDDLEKDKETGSYNPLLPLYHDEKYEEKCGQMLTLVLAECSSAFERLPCIEYGDILRNILYVGVWNKYDEKQKKITENEEGIEE